MKLIPPLILLAVGLLLLAVVLLLIWLLA